VRIVYGLQSTGKGHLSRFLGMKPFFERDGHELLVIASGYEDPPRYFLEQIRAYRYARFRGISYVGDARGGISKSKTSLCFLWHLPDLTRSIRRAQELIWRFRPHLIVSDFDPITGSAFVAPDMTKVGLSHQNVLLAPGLVHPPGLVMEKFFTFSVVRAFTAGLAYRLGCHFYPGTPACLPPIIRPAIKEARIENKGHAVVYHTLPGMLEEIKRYAEAHPDRRFIVYGNEAVEETRNLHFERDRSKFASDLASADVYIGTAGFQSISEAFYLGKKVVVRPVEGQYEQVWNAAQLEYWKMGRWQKNSLEEALDQEFNSDLHRRLKPWFENGAATCYERIMSLAKA